MNNKILLESVVGSFNYGTNTKASDLDLILISQPTREQLFLNKKDNLSINKHENSELLNSKELKILSKEFSFLSDTFDFKVYDIRNLYNLLTNGSPNNLELLYSDFFSADETLEQLINIRDLIKNYSLAKMFNCLSGTVKQNLLKKNKSSKDFSEIIRNILVCQPPTT